MAYVVSRGRITSGGSAIAVLAPRFIAITSEFHCLVHGIEYTLKGGQLAVASAKSDTIILQMRT